MGEVEDVVDAGVCLASRSTCSVEPKRCMLRSRDPVLPTSALSNLPTEGLNPPPPPPPETSLTPVDPGFTGLGGWHGRGHAGGIQGSPVEVSAVLDPVCQED